MNTQSRPQPQYFVIHVELHDTGTRPGDFAGQTYRFTFDTPVQLVHYLKRAAKRKVIISNILSIGQGYK